MDQLLAFLALGAVVAMGVGLLAIRWTALAVVRQHFWKFAFYVIALGLVVLVVLLTGGGEPVTPAGAGG